MASAATDKKRPKTALILSAGAPHSPLIAGALCALWDTGKTFDVIYTSGAGALLGLLYAAPRGKAPKEALKGLVDLGVSDLIYRLLPIGYKTFFKPGPFTRPIRQVAQLFKLGGFPLPAIENPATGLGYAYNEWRKLWDTAGGGGLKRLYNDLVDLWAAAITPTPLNYWSKGVCEPLPFLEDLVDFQEVNLMPFHFYMNAFSITERQQALPSARITTTQRADYTREDFRTRELPERRLTRRTRRYASTERDQEGNPPEGGSAATSGLQMKLFYNKKGGIHPAEVRAAFAYPFIYPPVTINGEVYFEGAGRDPISFGNLLIDKGVRADVEDIERVVLIDILGALDQYLLREPRDLLDAFSLSILAPAVAHAQKEITRFYNALDEANEDLGEVDRELLRDKAKPKDKADRRQEALRLLDSPDQALARITHFRQMFFDIDEDLAPHITDWSYSNMSRLFQIGERDGAKFWARHREALDLPDDPRQVGSYRT